MRTGFRKLSCSMLVLFSLNAFAQDSDTIKVTVHTDEQTAAAIGCEVDGKKLGGPGKSYTCEGPKGKNYIFGFRKDTVHGTNVNCGSSTLDKDADITLTLKDGACTCAIQ